MPRQPHAAQHESTSWLDGLSEEQRGAIEWLEAQGSHIGVTAVRPAFSLIDHDEADAYGAQWRWCPAERDGNWWCNYTSDSELHPWSRMYVTAPDDFERGPEYVDVPGGDIYYRKGIFDKGGEV